VKRLATGAEAIGRGAAESGVAFVSGRPVSEPLARVLADTACEGVRTERAATDRLALLAAVGASLAGARALAVLPGLEGAADALHAGAVSGATGGLVVLAVDDPGLALGAVRSDSRALARALELPCVEPSDVRECPVHLAAAFELSERWSTVVVLRVTARLLLEARPVALGTGTPRRAAGLRRDRARRVLVPEHGPRLAARLEERLGQLAAEGVDSPLNRVELRSRALGVVTSGTSYHHVREALPDASVLKLGLSFPLPSELVRDFARAVERVAVVEEMEPVLESELRAAGIPCRGKDGLPRAGELSPDLVAWALSGVARPGRAVTQLEPRPPEACPGCPRRALFQALKRTHVGVMADLGCAAVGVFQPQAVVDAAFVAGAAPALAHGAAAVLGARVRGRLVALATEATFLHSGAQALAQAAEGGDGTLVVLEDGFAPMPGERRPDLLALARAFGGARVREVELADLAACEAALREELAAPGSSVIVARGRCPAAAPCASSSRILPERCNRCGACLRLGCPALSEGVAAMLIDAESCVACGLCAQVCRAGAIVRAEARA
jgi:indolepyruvate ferredoxin oxidoreductase alpha subunit